MNNLWKTMTNVVTRTLQAHSMLGCQLTSYIPNRHSSILKRLHKLHTRELQKVPKKSNPLDGKPFAKGVILKTVIRKPRKPNSANRKCVLVRLSTGKEIVSFVPGIGHNLQEHQTVLCRVGRLKDTPGVKIRCVRGKYDLPHVKSSNK